MKIQSCTFCGNEETLEQLLFKCTGTEGKRNHIRQSIREKRIWQTSDILPALDDLSDYLSDN